MTKTLVLVIIGCVCILSFSGMATATTIDMMTLTNSGGYSRTYIPDSSSSYWDFMLFGKASEYRLSDQTSWHSGAGSFYQITSELLFLEMMGTTIEYTFAMPTNGVIFRNTDYNNGEHSSQGTLGLDSPVTIRAELGSNTATMSGYTEILSNDATWYGEPRFNYYSANVGDFVYFEVTYTLLNARWTQDIFNRQFEYQIDGLVDFTKTAVIPEPNTVLLLGIGLIGLCVVRGKQLKR